MSHRGAGAASHRLLSNGIQYGDRLNIVPCKVLGRQDEAAATAILACLSSPNFRQVRRRRLLIHHRRRLFTVSPRQLWLPPCVTVFSVKHLMPAAQDQGGGAPYAGSEQVRGDGL